MAKKKFEIHYSSKMIDITYEPGMTEHLSSYIDKKEFDLFNYNLLNLGDLDLEGEQISAVAAMFDL